MKDPSNQDPTIGTVCGENSCASENDNQTWRDWTPTEQALISLSQLDPSSRVIFQTLSMAGMKKTEGFGKGSHMSQRQDDERAMQREINDLKRRLRFAQRRQSPPPAQTHLSTTKMITTTGKGPGPPQARLSPMRRSVTKGISVEAHLQGAWGTTP